MNNVIISMTCSKGLHMWK